jgi:tRNA(Ile)-lysidine synthase
MLKNIYPAVEENLLDNIKRFKAVDGLYKAGLEKVKKHVIELRGAEVIIPVHKLKPYLNTSLVFEIIRDYGFGEKQVAEVVKLATSDSGKFLANESYEIIKHRKNLIISPKKVQTKSVALIEKDSPGVEMPGIQIRAGFYTAENFKLNKSEAVAQLDAALIEFPLLVRQWKEGDYFYPLGLRKKKKLSRFFIDQKLSRIDKEKVWIVESSERIVWIAGIRIDDRFKITKKTKEIVELTISNL